MRTYDVTCLLNGYTDMPLDDVDKGALYELEYRDDDDDRGEYSVECKYSFEITADSAQTALAIVKEELEDRLNGGKIACGDIKGLVLADREDENSITLHDITDETDEPIYQLFLEVGLKKRSILINAQYIWFHIDCSRNNKYGTVNLYQHGDTEGKSIINTLVALKEAIYSQQALSPKEYIDSLSPVMYNICEVKEFEGRTISEIRGIRPVNKYKTKWYEVKL